jgi:uncharacterized protein YggT (Ycf19 family)
MKNLRVLCWVWIVASTLVILIFGSGLVTRQDESRPQVTSIEWIGPFGKPFRSHAVTKSSIDFSRLIVVLLAGKLPARCIALAA